jgi:hypothetical protein
VDSQGKSFLAFFLAFEFCSYNFGCLNDALYFYLCGRCENFYFLFVYLYFAYLLEEIY